MVSLMILALTVAGVVFWVRGRRQRRVLSGLSRLHLTGNMAGLAQQALSDINTAVGPVDHPCLQQTYQEVAGFLAAMRYYCVTAVATSADDLISAGLSSQSAFFIKKSAARYQQLPPGSDRDQAIAVRRWMDQQSAAGVVVGMAGLAIEKFAKQGR